MAHPRRKPHPKANFESIHTHDNLSNMKYLLKRGSPYLSDRIGGGRSATAAFFPISLVCLFCSRPPSTSARLFICRFASFVDNGPNSLILLRDLVVDWEVWVLWKRLIIVFLYSMLFSSVGINKLNFSRISWFFLVLDTRTSLPQILPSSPLATYCNPHILSNATYC